MKQILNIYTNCKIDSKYLMSIFVLISFTNISYSQMWVQQGPAPKVGGQVEGMADASVSGAINCVAPHPSDASILYIGAANGGVWRTTDANAAVPNWTLLDDGMTSQAIGALEFDPTDASNQTLVVANGFTSSIRSRGSGIRSIFKTTNGVAPWTNIDPNTDLPVATFTGVAPRGNTIVVSIKDEGIYRTTNNGNDWIEISGQLASALPVGTAWDLVSDPLDNSILYTVIADLGIYKSINTGEIWNKVSDVVIDNLLADVYETKMTVGTNNNVFIGIISRAALTGVFRSGDGGVTWTPLDLPVTVEDGIALGLLNNSPSRKLFSITADPSDGNLVYVGGKSQPKPTDWPNSLGAENYTGRLFRIDASLLAGNQVSAITHDGTASNSAPHSDSRDMDFDANGDLIEGDDGGVFIQSSAQDGTGDWLSLNGNLNISEAHSADWDRLSGILKIGMQDNGVAIQQAVGSQTWDNVRNGDGGDIAIGSIDGVLSTRYYSSQRLGTFALRQYDAAGNYQAGSYFTPALTDVVTSNSISDVDSFGFVTPIALNSQDATRLLIGSESQIYESFDQGTTVTSILLKEVNGSLDPGRDVLVYGATDNAEIIYAGINDTVQVRTIAAGAFNVAAGYAGGTVNGITIKPDDSQTAYVIDYDNIYETENGGVNFDNISGNLSGLNPGRLLSIVYMPDDINDRIAIGTETGVYFAAAPNFDFWVELATNLPQVRIEELVYDENEKKLAASTLGRGLWTYTFVERDPVDIALVLDFSGSMLNEACVGCEPKIDVLKGAVEIFLQIWKLLAVGDDEVTTVYFRTEVDKLNIGGNENLDVIDSTDEIIADINGQTTVSNEFTALGGGLQTGITELSNVARPRHVILFTDGMQNVDPGIRYPELDILDGEFARLSNVVESSPTTVLDNLGDIRVHTIGVGATPAFETQLSDISNASNGLTKITTAPDDDLIQFYIEELIEILRDFSPQLIAYRKNTYTGPTIESVDINPSASQVLFKVSYPEGEQFDTKIYKDGNDITGLAKIVRGDFYDIYHYPFDMLAQVRALSTTNAWEVRLSNGNPSFKYQLAVIADEKILDYSLGITNPGIFSGTPAKIYTKLFTSGIKFKGDAKVTAVIRRPRKSIGNLLAGFKIPKSGKLKLEKGLSIGERKYAYMIRDEKYKKMLQPRTSTLALKQNNKGEFHAMFKNTNVCGNYTVDFKIEGKNEEIGYFQRIESRNFIVEFGKFMRKKSKFNLEKIDKLTWKLYMKPIDKFGNLLGPDQLRNFNLGLKKGKILDKKDNGDGSYEFIFKPDPKNPVYQLKYKNAVWIKPEKLN